MYYLEANDMPRILDNLWELKKFLADMRAGQRNKEPWNRWINTIDDVRGYLMADNQHHSVHVDKLDREEYHKWLGLR